MLEENNHYFCILVSDFFNAEKKQSRWENLDYFQYQFQLIKFVNSVVSSPYKTKPIKIYEFNIQLPLLS